METTVAPIKPDYPFALSDSLTPSESPGSHIKYEQLPIGGSSNGDLMQLQQELLKLYVRFLEAFVSLLLHGTPLTAAPLARIESIHRGDNQTSLMFFDGNGRFIRQVLDASLVYGNSTAPLVLEWLRVPSDLIRSVQEATRYDDKRTIIIYRPRPTALNTPDNWAWSYADEQVEGE